jgi:site-specific DNA-methyltransferase (adenine-specific)
MIELNKIYLGDCLDIMPSIDDKSIDMICCDLPYGVVNKKNKHAKSDSVIPFDLLWKEYKRIIKDNGAIVLFGQGLFAYKLALSNEDWFKYDLIWKKGERTSGFLNAKKMQLRNHELILVFYNKFPTYNPQFTIGTKSHSRGNGNAKNNIYGDFVDAKGEAPNGELKYPKSILNFEKPHPPKHPTEKPVLLLENLIKTYTNENELVLDNTCGYASTCVAAKNINRKFIGIEKDEIFYNMSIERMKL